MIVTGTVLLGKYTVISRLGEGGMGTVYRAHDEMLDRDVAIKLLRPELAGQGGLVERFRGEAIALARLAHPGIATLHGFEREGEQFYMVMEFLKGETLEDIVRRRGPLPWQQAVGICAAVCDALSHAHKQGVVHRDIKPANIMLDESGTIKVMDFGIARMVGSSRQTRHGSTVGTPNYMAPEQLRGEETDGRTDLYAVGAVLFELISGQMSFEADSDYALMMKQLNNSPPVPGSVVNDVPGHVDDIVARAMAKRPTDRFDDATAMRKALERAAEGQLPFTAPHPIVAVASAPGRLISQARQWLDDDEPSDVLAPPLNRDWRIWASGIALIAAGAIWFGSGSGPAGDDDPTPGNLAQDSVAITDPAISAAGRDGSGSGTFVGAAGNYGLGADQPPLSEGERLVPISPSPSPPPSPSPRRPAERQPDRRESTTPPPPPPAPTPVSEPSAAELEAAARNAVAAWFGSFGSGSPGIVDAELRKLLDEKRVLMGSSQAARASVSGSTASASASATLKVRSAFGGSRDVSVRFSFDLRQEGGSWRVTRAKLADTGGL